MSVEVREEYHFNGNLKSKAHYLNGKMHGIREEYNVSGKLTDSIPYKNNLLHGLVKRYTITAGKIYMEIPYIDGKRHGIGTNFYKNEVAKYYYYLYGKNVTKEEYRREELTKELAGI